MKESSGISWRNFLTDFMVGGISASISKTIVAPIEKVQQFKHKPIIDRFAKVYKELGFKGFWKGNYFNVIRYFPA